MNKRTFQGWLIAAALALGAAILAVITTAPEGQLDADPEPAFPALRAEVGLVTLVEVATADSRLTLRRVGQSWEVVERDGFPANAEAVRDVLVTLNDMRLVEPKTAEPELYERLDLRPLDDPDSRATGLRVEGPGEVMLADLLVGKTAARRVGQAERGTYIRLQGEERSWLASGALEVPQEVGDWIAADILDVPRNDLAEIVIRPADGAEITVMRADQEADLSYLDVPAGRSVRSFAVNRLASMLVNVEAEDVRRFEPDDWAGSAGRVEARTFDGAAVTVTLYRENESWWGVFEVTQPADQEKPALEVGTIEGWIFRLPDFVGERILVDRESLLEPLAEPE